MRTTALAKRIIQQMLRDKRALALMMVAPLLIITLLHYLFSTDDITPIVGVIEADDSFIEQLEDNDVDVIHYNIDTNINKTIIDDDLDGMVRVDDGTFHLTLKNEQTSTSRAIEVKVVQAIATIEKEKQTDRLTNFMEKIEQNLPGNVPEIEPSDVPEVDTSYLYGNEDTTYFDQLSPIFVSFFVFFFVFIISGIAILRERTSGTLERLMATPILRRDIVFGYILGYGLFAIIQTFIVVLYAINVLDIMLVGSFWHVVIINLLLAFVALSLGVLLSAFANSEFQMMQFIPIVIIPQIFFAGIIPVDSMANWLQVIAKCMPMYYGGNAIVDVMYKGLGLSDIKYDLLILVSFAFIFMILNIFALKKYRNI